MKPNRLELAVLSLTVVFVLFTTGFFLFHRNADGVFTVETETASPSSQPGKSSGSPSTGDAPAAGNTAAAEVQSIAPQASAAASAAPAGLTASASPSPAAKTKLNLNTATESQLDTLPGIGPTRAAAIVAYRTKNGPFQSIRDIMKVSGIKSGIFSKIENLITVK